MAWAEDTSFVFETEPKEKVISPLIPLLGVGLLLLLLLPKKQCKTCGG